MSIPSPPSSEGMRDGLVDLPSLGQAAGVRHVRTKFVTLLHIFIIHEVGFSVNP